ncbi:MAG: ATPase [Candidatus Aenigmarchaeota archaeon]|nr:ATPase [Candidatus Aenigmarchaeota archaeon]NIP40102.1 ATPase [Candidatus Aenigmarchaeota archaeon]NIQ18179.1 ATPase [Candidatus Aenigmarchaeota archaeon]NIS72936.1 ATPase [Candidatus Aenigmarchaeota archaeon]
MKVNSGIPGLDELIGGGFEEGSVNLVSGKTGTGKSIFCAQFLHNGAVNNNEKGLYLTTGETINNIKKQSKNFEWDFEALEKKGVIKLMEIEPFDIETLIERITENIEAAKAKRVVIDSVSMFELYMHEPFKIRKSLYKVLQRLRDMGKTVLVVAEVLEDSKSLSRFGVIEFMVDSVILLQYLGIAKYKRSLLIRKMRMTDHSTDIHPFEITPKGITIRSV